jgi:hypothetical protein
LIAFAAPCALGVLGLLTMRAMLCYNLSILVHAMHKPGIEPSFLGKVAA